jgi:predicted trehalose synthase
MTTPARPDPLAAWLAGQRWFASKTRRIDRVAVVEHVQIGDVDLELLEVTLDDGTAARYAVWRGPATSFEGTAPDAAGDPDLERALLALIAGDRWLEGRRGVLLGRRTSAFPPLPADVPSRRLGGEQSNTSVVVGDALIVKHLRRVTPALHPEVEMGRFLTERTAFAFAPRLAGTLAWQDTDGAEATLLIAHELVAGGRDGWRWLLERLADGDDALEAIGRLGAITARLHLALAAGRDDPAFAPEPIGAADVAGWTAAVTRQVAAARAALDPRPLPEPPAQADALAGLAGCVKIRHHGDFHLGQTLRVPDDRAWMLIDFEGEPLRPLDERRRKHTPLRDVAGLLRSLDYAATSARFPAEGAARRWLPAARGAFLEAYRATAGTAPFVPAGAGAFARAVAFLELEKAAYEIVYEANNRPDWIEVPVRGFVSAVAALGRGTTAGPA